MISLASALFLAVLPVSAAPPIDHPAAANATPKPTAPAPLPAWWGRVNAGLPGSFPTPHPFKASYRVTWEGLEAAHFDSDCTLGNDGSQICSLVKVQTTGMARTLWKFDATHLSVVDRQTLKPLRIEQTEIQSRKQSVSGSSSHHNTRRVRAPNAAPTPPSASSARAASITPGCSIWRAPSYTCAVCRSTWEKRAPWR